MMAQTHSELSPSLPGKRWKPCLSEEVIILKMTGLSAGSAGPTARGNCRAGGVGAAASASWSRRAVCSSPSPTGSGPARGTPGICRALLPPPAGPIRSPAPDDPAAAAVSRQWRGRCSFWRGRAGYRARRVRGWGLSGCGGCGAGRGSRGFWGGGACGANAWLLGYIYMKNGIVIAVACAPIGLSPQQYSFRQHSSGPSPALLKPEPHLSLKWHISAPLKAAPLPLIL